MRLQVTGYRSQVTGRRFKFSATWFLVFSFWFLILSSFALAESTFFDNPDEAFIMGNIVSPGPVTPPSGGGGGGGAAVECVDDLGCEVGEYCFENKCYV